MSNDIFQRETKNHADHVLAKPSQGTSPSGGRRVRVPPDTHHEKDTAHEAFQSTLKHGLKLITRKY